MNLYSTEQLENMILAALFYKPEHCMNHLHSVKSARFSSPIRGALALGAASYLEENGQAIPTPIVEPIAEKYKVDVNRLYDDIIDAQEWHSFIHNDGSVQLFLKELERINREASTNSSLELLAKELVTKRADLSSARLVIDQLIEDSKDSSTRLQTLHDTLETDPAEEPVEILKTGLAWFDGALPNEGFQRGDKVVFSAPPGAGKTALALQLALNILDFNQNSNVLWCLGEMTTKALRNRALQCVSGLPMDVLRGSWESMPAVPSQKKREAVDLLKDLGSRFHFLPAPLTPKTIEDAIIETRADFVAVDYLQLVRPDEQNQASRRDEIDSVVREFMRISQKHAPVLFLISDMAKGSEVGRDIFSAFKESSEIPFAADLAYVAEIVGERDSQGEWPEPLEMQLRCLKARHGRSTNIRVQFSRDTQRFAGSLQYV